MELLELVDVELFPAKKGQKEPLQDPEPGL